MDFETMLGGLGKGIDQDLIEWRRKGVRGDEQARQRFRKEQFHSARGIMRLAVELRVFQDPELTRVQALEATKGGFIGVASHQADQSGFDEGEKAYYVGITHEAIASLAEHYQAEP